MSVMTPQAANINKTASKDNTFSHFISESVPAAQSYDWKEKSYDSEDRSELISQSNQYSESRAHDLKN